MVTGNVNKTIVTETNTANATAEINIAGAAA